MPPCSEYMLSVHAFTIRKRLTWMSKNAAREGRRRTGNADPASAASVTMDSAAWNDWKSGRTGGLPNETVRRW